MANPPDIKRLRAEDFPGESQELISKLSYILNPFMDSVFSIFSRNIDFRNINQEIKTVSITTTTEGKLSSPIQLSLSIKGNPVGIIPVSLSPKTSTSVIPQAIPFVVYSIDRTINITDIKGLSASSEYDITLLIIGGNV